MRNVGSKYVLNEGYKGAFDIDFEAHYLQDVQTGELLILNRNDKDSLDDVIWNVFPIGEADGVNQLEHR